MMKATDKIYIAGHNGLVGSALVRVLKAAGFTNLVFRTSKELDLRNQAAVEEFAVRVTVPFPQTFETDFSV